MYGVACGGCHVDCSIPVQIYNNRRSRHNGWRQQREALQKLTIAAKPVDPVLRRGKDLASAIAVHITGHRLTDKFSGFVMSSYGANKNRTSLTNSIFRPSRISRQSAAEIARTGCNCRSLRFR